MNYTVGNTGINNSQFQFVDVEYIFYYTLFDLLAKKNGKM